MTRRALIMGAGLTAGALAACRVGGGPGDGTALTSRGPATLRFKAYIANDQVRQSYEKGFAAWKEQNPSIAIEEEFSDSATFSQQVTAQIAGGTPPDVSVADSDWYMDWALDGVLLPLDEYMKTARVGADEWFSGPMEYGQVRGKYYGLPITGYTTLLFYNRNLFQEAGVPLPPADGSWRWKDLETAAIKLTRRSGADPQQSQWGLLPQFHPSFDVTSAIWQSGGALTDTRESPTRTTLTDAKSVEAIQWLVDLHQLHRVVPTAAERTALGATDPFVQGKVAMYWAGASLFFTTMAQVQDFWWDLVPGPRGPGGTQAAGARYHPMAAYQATKRPDAAFELVRFFAAGTGMRIRADIQGLLVAHKKTLDEVWLRRAPAVNRKAVLDSHAYTKSNYKGRPYNQWEAAIRQPLQRARDGALGVRAAAEEATAQGNVILEQARTRG